MPPLVQEQSQKRHLVLVSGFIHDVGSFIDEHPGGPHLLIKMIGKDATTAFFGGVYDHSNAAHNVSPCFPGAYILTFGPPLAVYYAYIHSISIIYMLTLILYH
jgi:cytochrome b5-like protein